MLLAATAAPNSSRSPWSQALLARVLLSEALSATFAAKASLWLHGALTVFGATKVWSLGTKALGGTLGALLLAALVATLAFFRTKAAQGAVFELATSRGLSRAALQRGLVLARVWLVFRPFLVSVPVLWLAALGADTALASWFMLPGGIIGAWLCALGLSVCLALLAWLSEQWAPERPARLLFALILIPALLEPAVPELPSLWHGFKTWTSWVVAKASQT